MWPLIELPPASPVVRGPARRAVDPSYGSGTGPDAPRRTRPCGRLRVSVRPARQRSSPSRPPRRRSDPYPASCCDLLRRSRPGPGVFQHRRGRLVAYTRKLTRPADGIADRCKLDVVSPKVDTEDLIDARTVAE